MYSLAYVYITILSSKLIIIATIISLSLWAHCHTHTCTFQTCTVHCTYYSPWTMHIFWMWPNIVAATPFAVIFWLKSFDERVHRDFHGVFSKLVDTYKKSLLITNTWLIRKRCVERWIEIPALTMWCPLSVIDPSQRCKIRGFGTIEAMIVSRMVAKRKCNHNFASLLCNFIEWYLILA